MSFNPRTGSLVTLSNGNKTAQRRHAATEFNNGIVLSAEALRDNCIFEVKIDKKLNSWSGSIEIGVTTCDPEALVFPPSATGLKDGTWILSGTNVLKDGHSIREDYGVDLDTLGEGDCVGVMRTAQGTLHFFVNGIDQGAAVHNLPDTIHVVVDLYGKCMQVSVNSITPVDNSRLNHATMMTVLANSLRGCLITNGQPLAFHDKCGTLVQLSNGSCSAERRRPMDEFNNGVVMTNRPLMPGELFEVRLDCLIDKWSGSIEVGVTTHNPAELEFPATMTNMRSGTIMMSGCGILTNGKGTQREYGSFNLDELSVGDRIGVQRKINGNLHFYINGRDQGIAADEAPELIWGVVDLYGMAIKVTILHDHGSHTIDEHATYAESAARQSDGARCQCPVAADADSYQGICCNHGPAAEIPDPFQEGQLPERRAAPPSALSARGQTSAATNAEDAQSDACLEQSSQQEGHAGSAAIARPASSSSRLQFHARHGRHVTVAGNSRAAARLNASQDPGDAVLLTHRCLLADEVFEVRIDRVEDGWSESLEIGLSHHFPDQLEIPSFLAHLRTGTWLMTADGIFHNGTVIAADRGDNGVTLLRRLKVGDQVGVARKANGDLHFFLNGVDQGCAAQGLPAAVYGAINLCGLVTEARIVDSTISFGFHGRDIRFHQSCGRNCSLTNDGRTASRMDPRNEFNDAIVMSSRPLMDDELFELVIDNTISRWSGSIECGVTALAPEDMIFPGTVTDLPKQTWLWSGCAIMRDGITICNDYGYDLDVLGIGARVGIMRTSHGQLKFYVNGIEQGPACDNIPHGVYAIVDLYGQCAQVSVITPSRLLMTDCDSRVGQSSPAPSLLQSATRIPAARPESAEAAASGACSDSAAAKSAALSVPVQRFNQYCGKNVVLRNDCTTACRVRGFDHGTLFSSDPIKDDELFEVVLEQTAHQWSGGLRIGLTTIIVSENTPATLLQSTATGVLLKGRVTWLVCGSEVKRNGVTIKENYATALERIEVSNRVGVKRAKDSSMHIFIDGKDLGIAATGIPRNTFVIIDLYGSADTISICSRSRGILKQPTISQKEPIAITSTEFSEVLCDDIYCDSSVHAQFHPTCHGKNVVLSNNLRTAVRTAGYDEGLVFSKKPLQRNEVFKVRMDRMNTSWSSSLMIGVTPLPPPASVLPSSATMLRDSCWLIRSNAVLYNGRKVREHYCCDLESLSTAHSVGVSLDLDGGLHVFINDIDQGVAVKDVGCSQAWHGFVDLYGGCDQVTIIGMGSERNGPCSIDGREKADMETSAKEKVQKFPGTVCSYQNLCERFRQYLALPDEFFKPKYNICFCDVCWRHQCASAGDGVVGDDDGCTLPYRTSGIPPRRYALPLGWCRLGLRIKGGAKTQKIFENWHTAYCGAWPETVRHVLDTADLFSIGNCGDEGSLLLLSAEDSASEEKNLDDRDLPQLAVAPGVQQAVADFPHSEYTDAVSGHLHRVRLAFQLCIKPGSYTVASPSRLATATISEQVDPKCEGWWSTKESGAAVICGLLIKIE